MKYLSYQMKSLYDIGVDIQKYIIYNKKDLVSKYL